MKPSQKCRLPETPHLHGEHDPATVVQDVHVLEAPAGCVQTPNVQHKVADGRDVPTSIEVSGVDLEAKPKTSSRARTEKPLTLTIGLISWMSDTTNSNFDADSCSQVNCFWASGVSTTPCTVTGRTRRENNRANEGRVHRQVAPASHQRRLSIDTATVESII